MYTDALHLLRVLEGLVIMGRGTKKVVKHWFKVS